MKPGVVCQTILPELSEPIHGRHESAVLWPEVLVCSAVNIVKLIML